MPKTVLPSASGPAICNNFRKAEKLAADRNFPEKAVSGTCGRRAAAATMRLLQTARFGKRLTSNGGEIETWTARELHDAKWLPARRKNPANPCSPRSVGAVRHKVNIILCLI
jgi:hypothetical protein